MSLRILFLDDNKERHRVFQQRSIGCLVDHVFDADSALDKLRSEYRDYDIIFFDHDLDAELENQIVHGVKDGRYVIRQMIEENLIEKHKDALFVIHSLNRVAAIEMGSMMDSCGIINYRIVPFAWSKFSFEERKISFD